MRTGRVLTQRIRTRRPESIKDMQRNWIGRSEGAQFGFGVLSADGAETAAKIDVYTTRPDTIFGATYVVIAPEHPLALTLTVEAHRATVAAYVETASRKSDLERTELAKEKTGVWTGSFVRNPATGEAIPVWVAGARACAGGCGGSSQCRHVNRHFAARACNGR